MDLDPNSQSNLDALEATLRKAGEEADAAPEVDIVPPSEAAPTPEPKKEAPKPGEDTLPKVEKPPGEEKPPGTEDPPETPYTKAKKDGERLDRSWKKLEEEKEALRRDREALATKPPGEQNPAPKKDEPLRDAEGYSASDYKEAAQALRERGDDDLADKAEAKAKELETAQTAKAEESVHSEHVEEWRSGMAKTVDADPELQKPDSPLSLKVRELLNSGPFFHVFPNGFPMAVESAKLQIKAARVDELQEQVRTLEDEVKNLREATSIGGGNPSPPPGAQKPIDQLPADEAEALLRRQAAAVDASPT